MKINKWHIILFAVLFVATIITVSRKSVAVVPTVAETQITVTLADLKKYDGSDASKPIYLAYEGNIYDVTSGKQWYQPNGAYHWLTGKDATTDLNLVGGDIIKRKYPVVGKLIQ